MIKQSVTKKPHLLLGRVLVFSVPLRLPGLVCLTVVLRPADLDVERVTRVLADSAAKDEEEA